MRKKKTEPYWTPERLKAAWELVEEAPTCDHCGGHHNRACPRVKRMVYYPPNVGDGMHLQEVEFFPHGEWPHEDVVFADLLPYPPDEED